MRDKVLRIKRVREVRADARYKDLMAARGALASAERRLDGLRHSQTHLHQDATRRISEIGIAEEVASAGDIALLKMALDALGQQLARIVEEIEEATRVRDEKEHDVQEAAQAYRTVMKSVDQLSEVNNRLLAEEVKLEEQTLEMESERIGRPISRFGKKGPAK